MRFDFYNSDTTRVAEEFVDLQLRNNIPHLTEHGGDGKITIDTKLRRVVFKQDGGTNEYNNVNFIVNRAFTEYEFEFKHLSQGGYVLEVSHDFALKGIKVIYITTQETINKNIEEVIHANGYKY